MTDVSTTDRPYGRRTAPGGDPTRGGTMATYRIHVRSDEFQYENEVHATRVDKGGRLDGLLGRQGRVHAHP